ncbi:hypothetical protein TKK_0012992 [Trichogramma kaykai]
MYPDDLQIYSHCSREDLPALVRCVNQDVATIKDSADRNGLMLNIFLVTWTSLGPWCCPLPAIQSRYD